MDETIGSKGGHNDTIRRLRIQRVLKKKKQEEEEERELKELEERVKKLQRRSLIRTIPIIVAGGFVKSLLDIKGSNDNKVISSTSVPVNTPVKVEEKPTKKAETIVTPTGEVVVIRFDNPFEEDRIVHVLEGIKEEKKVEEEKREDIHEEKEEIAEISSSVPIQAVDAPEKVERAKPEDKIGIELGDVIDLDKLDFDIQKLPKSSKDLIDKLKIRRLVDEYSKRLKDVRYELRQVVYDLNVLGQESDEVVFSEEAEGIIDRLTVLIDRIDELRTKLKIEDLEKYDDNYLYVLIEDYLKDFSNRRMIKEIKDSKLYIMISDKIREADQKKEKLTKKVEVEKDKLQLREIRFEQLRDRYYSLDRLTRDIDNFRREQEALIEELNKKLETATTISEKTRLEFDFINRSNKGFLSRLAFNMFLPGLLFGKGAALMGAAYTSTLGQFRTGLVERKYKVVSVKDYSNEISNGIEAVEYYQGLIGKSVSELDRMIEELKEKFHDYFGVLPECDSMFNDLYRIRSSLREKEYEMGLVKAEQERILERNNAKVKTMGSYPVN